MYNIMLGFELLALTLMCKDITELTFEAAVGSAVIYCVYSICKAHTHNKITFTPFEVLKYISHHHCHAI